MLYKATCVSRDTFSRGLCRIVPLALMSWHPKRSSSFIDVRKLLKHDLDTMMIFQAACPIGLQGAVLLYSKFQFSHTINNYHRSRL